MALTRIGKLAVFFGTLLVITQVLTMYEVGRLEREDGRDLGTQLDMGVSATIFAVTMIVMLAFIARAICANPAVKLTPSGIAYCSGSRWLFSGFGGRLVDVWGLLDGAFTR